MIKRTHGEKLCYQLLNLEKTSTKYLFISPMVELELESLYEIGRINGPASEVILSIQQHIPIHICNKPMTDVIRLSKTLKWTRDPFDRIITAQAALGSECLISADRTIGKNYSYTIW